MRRITSPCLAALLIAAIAISTAAAPDWRGQAAPIGGSVACNVGLITGTVGELTTFNSTGGGTSALTTTGGVGAKWNGNDYPHADSIAAQKVNDVVHQYARHSTDPATFTVNLTSNITQTGSARQFSPSTRSGGGTARQECLTPSPSVLFGRLEVAGCRTRRQSPRTSAPAHWAAMLGIST